MRKNLPYQKTKVALLLLLAAAIAIPCLTGIGMSTISDTEQITPDTQDRAFNASIVRPVRALYLNDMKIYPKSGTFRLIQRGIVFGDITIEVTAFDDTHGIDYVEFLIDTTRVATDNETPYEYFWTDWNPGIHLLDARAFNNQGSYVDSESFQIIKFG